MTAGVAAGSKARLERDEVPSQQERHCDDVSFLQAASKKICCGGAAGCLSRTLTAPIDRVRLLMMTSSEPLGLLGALRKATEGRGVKAMWQGNGVNCIKITPEMSMKLMAFDFLKMGIARDPDNIQMSERFVAGGAAGAISQLTIYPMEVARTRLALTTQRSETIASVLRSVVREKGFGALYAGLGPSIGGIIPYAAIDLSLNSLLKDVAVRKLIADDREISVPLLLGCGMLSSATATIATFPLNVIRTKAQATGDSFTTIVKAIHGEGWKGFYRGLVPCMMKVLPATSVSYAAYDYFGKAWDGLR